jgi:hypothetical protein
MADKDWPRGRGEASYLTNLKITTEFLDSNYDLINENLTRSETRLLKVFSLNPKSGNKPSFHARIDDGSSAKRKDPELDIDIDGVSPSDARDFKANRNDYQGHHNKRATNPNERAFDVVIALPTGMVFKGQVSFNVTFSVGLHMSTTSEATVDATVVRASWLARLRIRLTLLWECLVGK